MNTSLAELLNLRTEFEEIINSYKIPDDKRNSSIDSLVWFKDNSKSSNHLRSGYERAVEIAHVILKEYEYEKSNLSGLRRKKVEAL